LELDVRLTKHHGLGNDFLVLLDRDGSVTLSPELVRDVCDRRRGVGADGLMRATPALTEGVDARMELFNADGSVAEMSGNGIRCLGQALLLEDWTAREDRVVIATHAGVRTLTVHKTIDERPGAGAKADDGDQSAGRAAGLPSTAVLSVDMGAARVGGLAPEWIGGSVQQAMWADMGNPHLVALVEDVDPGGDPGDELVMLGEQVNAKVTAGANVHFVTVGPGDAVTMRTYERGVGLTQACGTGACAAAAVAHEWGLVGPSVTVDMPGGRAVVDLGATVTLTGPAVAVAAIDYPWPS
jgi:diaminopimelate epimerase